MSVVFNAFDAFGEQNKDSKCPQEDMIHIRIQQRNGRKTLTSVQGLSEEYDLNHGLKYTCKTLLQKKDGNQVVPLDSGFISVRALYDASFEKSRRHFACNGTVVEHSEYGEVIQFQGDQRDNISRFLREVKLARPEQIKIHGF